MVFRACGRNVGGNVDTELTRWVCDVADKNEGVFPDRKYEVRTASTYLPAPTTARSYPPSAHAVLEPLVSSMPTVRLANVTRPP